ncbi:MAG TPA: hypothetical protein VMR62_00760, partial [Bryobacteraceae bacterium]|nr:hypothetical protein [Bryobacteraceae bacterium]
MQGNIVEMRNRLETDRIQPLREFVAKIFRVHAKDARINRRKLNEAGILAHPLEYHDPRLPG